MAAQSAAITSWRQVRGERLAELKSITQPTLVVNGSNDVMVPTINSFSLSQEIHSPQRTTTQTPGTAHCFNTLICSCRMLACSSMDQND